MPSWGRRHFIFFILFDVYPPHSRKQAQTSGHRHQATEYNSFPSIFLTITWLLLSSRSHKVTQGICLPGAITYWLAPPLKITASLLQMPKDISERFLIRFWNYTIQARMVVGKPNKPTIQGPIILSFTTYLPSITALYNDITLHQNSVTNTDYATATIPLLFCRKQLNFYLSSSQEWALKKDHYSHRPTNR